MTPARLAFSSQQATKRVSQSGSIAKSRCSYHQYHHQRSSRAFESPLLARAWTDTRTIANSSGNNVARPRISSSPSLNAASKAFFSTTPCRRLRTTELDEEKLKSLKVNQARLMEELHHTCQWGVGKRWGSDPTETGMNRLSLTDSDHLVRDWFVDTCRSIGCETTVDAMGNIFAVRRGLNNDLPPVYAGSHLDTQPTGGRYDGILGVLAGMEMIRVLNDNWIETEGPVGVVNWTNEEGARFPLTMTASGVWAGETPLEKAYGIPAVLGGDNSLTMKSELQRIGYLGTTPCSHEAMPMAAHFELHIEQGPMLEAEKRKVGIVKGVQAYKWYTIEVTGREAHTGTTPLNARADALLTAAKMMLHAHRTATAYSALASTGILTLQPGSTNTIPGSVRFSLDVRAAKDSTLELIEHHLRDAFDSIACGRPVESVELKGTEWDYTLGTTIGHPEGCSVKWTTDSHSPAVRFSDDCISCVRDSAASLFGGKGKEGVGGFESLTKEMVSGAGHDSVHTSKRCPTSMIFVPCKNGVSHNPEEYCSPEDCGIGAQVLLGAVVRYDRMRAERDMGATSWSE